MLWERLEKSAYALITAVLGGVVAYLLLRYLLPIFLPFLIAWGIAMLVRPVAERMSARIGVSKRICAAIILLLVLSLGALLVGWGFRRLTAELGELFSRWLSEYGSFEGLVSAWIGRIEQMIGASGLLTGGGDGSSLRDGLYGMLYELLTGLLSSLASGLSALAGRWITALPSVLFTGIVFLISCFYFCMDSDRIAKGLRELLPRSVLEALPRWKHRAGRLSRSYLKAYLWLLLLTFAVLFLGFTLLRVPYAFLIATVTAVVDLLPVLGIGTVLLPWAAFVLLGRQYFLGFGLLILYGTVLLLRQIVEPRLVGKSLGLHPLLTVFATYVGWRLFGLLGMLLAPVFALALKAVSPRVEENKD